ncbi:class I SAM-dependent methyltransferase [Oceanobacillus sp. CFH 90083]|uniref:class I SAM-dependent methyltransferase n=1 Tax=Oceanobacillus sp. CFH 90083 TaxID=2592336 RepID=UPI00128DBEC9|nr:class I SAM-dependent methyltransferase [Oceanobacillus sp. CFH 90083]
MKELFENNFEKYENPEKYDEMYSKYQDDLLYLMENVSGMDKPIIDLACGTGRLTIPMAKRGLNMVGVDLHGGMLSRAKQKAAAEQVNIIFEQQDCTELDLAYKSPLIFMTGNSFQHFLTNESQDALFQSVKKHLLPNGQFIFDTRNPDIDELSVDSEFEESHVNNESQTVIKKHCEAYNHETQILYCTTHTEIIENDQLVHTASDSISLRYVYPMELYCLLDSHGFELISLYGSWKKDIFTKDSTSMIVHCRLK